MDIQEKNHLFEQFKKTKTFKCFYSTLLQFDESLNCFVATEKWRNKEAELLTSAWWMFEEMQAAKAQAVPEGFVLVSAEQMSQWGHMANCAQEYGCHECYEARGYAHSLACEINAYFNVSEAQEPTND